MPFEIVRNDIARMQVDAIVSAASRLPRVNPGVDSAVYKLAGPELLDARKAIGCIEPGSAAITPAFALDAHYVIHAPTPVWEGGKNGEALLLRQTYDRCLELAVRYHCESIAFPLLASGAHGFPKAEALQVAIGAFSAFLMENEIQIYLVVFGKESVRLSEKLVHNVVSYIDENYVAAYELETYGAADAGLGRERYQIRRKAELRERAMAAPREMQPGAPLPRSKNLDHFLQKKDAGFMETLLELIRQRGLKNAAVYKKANISKQHFSKLVNNPNATITKPVAVAFALALELDLDQIQKLIRRAGYTLTNSSIFDLIIQYHIENRIYNVVEINIVLYEFDQILLGS